MFGNFPLATRSVDPFFGFDDVLGNYDRQMRHMMRELNRMERRFNDGDQLQSYQGPLTALTDRQAILPHICEQNGQQIVKFNFDVKGFKPEDVHIKTSDGRMIVSAKHEDVGEDHHAIREFRRMVTLPEGMQLEGMKSRLDHHGVLTVTAPFTAPAIEQNQARELPIQHEKAGATKAIK